MGTEPVIYTFNRIGEYYRKRFINFMADFVVNYNDQQDITVHFMLEVEVRGHSMRGKIMWLAVI